MRRCSPASWHTRCVLLRPRTAMCALRSPGVAAPPAARCETGGFRGRFDSFIPDLVGCSASCGYLFSVWLGSGCCRSLCGCVRRAVAARFLTAERCGGDGGGGDPRLWSLRPITAPFSLVCDVYGNRCGVNLCWSIWGSCGCRLLCVLASPTLRVSTWRAPVPLSNT